MLVRQHFFIKAAVKIDVVDDFFCIPVDHRHIVEIIAVVVKSAVVDLVFGRRPVPALGVDDIVLVVRTRKFRIQVLNSFIRICAGLGIDHSVLKPRRVF